MASKNLEDIAALLKGLRFRKKLIGGIDEADVWRQMELIHREYQSVLNVQQERSKALLEERDAQIELLKSQLAAAGTARGGANG
ncbi:MAG: hypothetical protein KH452_02770 [Clostridiales bacterium]|nr:hypothetical protein [Clostridiales bacterium]